MRAVCSFVVVDGDGICVNCNVICILTGGQQAGEPRETAVDHHNGSSTDVLQ